MGTGCWSGTHKMKQNRSPLRPHVILSPLTRSLMNFLCTKGKKAPYIHLNHSVYGCYQPIFNFLAIILIWYALPHPQRTHSSPC